MASCHKGRINFLIYTHKMLFPRKGVLVALVTTVVLVLIGFPLWIASLFGVMGFLGTGGLQYCKIFIRTFPVDLWMGKNLLAMMKNSNRVKKDKLYVSDLFQETAAKYPNKVAIYFEDRTITFRELDILSNKIAHHFLAQGLQRGDAVAMLMENCLEYIPVFLGLSKIGAVAALINSNLRQEALIHCIKVSSCRNLVFNHSLGEAVKEVWEDLDPGVRDHAYSVGGDAGMGGVTQLEGLLESVSASNPPPVHGKSSEDSVCYIYTSGTTGMPKACVMKHGRFCSLPDGVTVFAGVRADDVIYCTLPLYHSNGGMLATGQMLFVGASFVIRKKFSASNFWTDCIKYKCTVFFYIGEICRYILAQPKRPTDTQHCVRLIVGNGLRYEVWKDFIERFKIAQVAELYGSTEGNVGLMNSLNKIGACGRVSVVLPFLNPVSFIKVDENGDYIRDSHGFCVPTAVDEPGECLGAIKKSQARSQFHGYTDKSSTSKKILNNVFRAGDSYFRSGDILRVDEEGFVYFCDRTGDTFRWKGENVSTAEVEATMAHILELTDVVVYGVEVPGNEGRAGMAAIVGTPDTVDLSTLPHQLSLSLPPYAVPIFVRLIESAELTGTFKLLKVKLRNEGFDGTEVTDPLYMLRGSSYVPLTEELHKQLLQGTIRV